MSIFTRTTKPASTEARLFDKSVELRDEQERQFADSANFAELAAQAGAQAQELSHKAALVEEAHDLVATAKAQASRLLDTAGVTL